MHCNGIDFFIERLPERADLERKIAGYLKEVDDSILSKAPDHYKVSVLVKPMFLLPDVKQWKTYCQRITVAILMPSENMEDRPSSRSRRGKLSFPGLGLSGEAEGWGSNFNE